MRTWRPWRRQSSAATDRRRPPRHLSPAAGPTRKDPARAVAGLRAKRSKLLDLYYADAITQVAFQEEESRLSTQIDALQSEAERQEEEHAHWDGLAQRFEEVAAVLRTLDVDTIWHEATDAERRVLVEELVDSVVIFPDHLEVEVSGAPPLTMTLAEVGLKASSTRSCVSEGGQVL